MENFDTTGEDQRKLLEAQVLYFYKELEKMLFYETDVDVCTIYEILKKYREHFGIHHTRIVK